MNLDDLLPIIKNVEEARDDLARGIVAELLLISRIPEKEPIAVVDLIEDVYHDSIAIHDEVMSFEFAYWAQGTILEIIDFMIVLGVLEGPMVDMTDESDKLLEAHVARTDQMEDYVDALMDDISDYDDMIGDVCDD